MAKTDHSTAGHGRPVQFVDTTLRDAHQCLWATRMTTAMMLPACEHIERAGYAAIDFMGMVQFDVCVRYLHEDPWERIRLVKERISAPLKAYMRSKSLIGFDVLPDDINALWVQRLVANGIGMVAAFDALADLDNIVPNLLLARELGARTCGALVFCESPVHTDAFYAAKARELVSRAKVDWLMIKDSGGLLGIDRVRTLVPAIQAAIGDTPIELHSHCLTGLTPLVYHEAVRLGVQIVDTATSPLSDGPAQPATQTMVRNLRAMGFRVDLDLHEVEAVGDYLRQLAAQEGKPLGAPMAYDAFHYQHQMPGGMLTNLKSQLATAGLADKYDAVLEECARIRQELAWPIMVTPFAQLVGTQAVLNIVHGERYRVVPDEVKKYVLGYYGKLLADIDPEVMDRVITHGSERVKLKPEPPAPGLDALRRKYPNASDDERLLRFCLAGDHIDHMRPAGTQTTPYTIHQPLTRLIKEMAARPRWHYFRLEGKGVDLTLHSSNRQGAAHG